MSVNPVNNNVSVSTNPTPGIKELRLSAAKAAENKDSGSVLSTAWDYLEKAGSWIASQAKETAGFWNGKPSSMVTGKDIAATAVVAAAPYITFVCGCGPAAEVAGEGGGDLNPDDIMIIDQQGMYAPRLETFDGTKQNIDFNFTVFINNLRGVDSIPVAVGTKNSETAGKVYEDILSCGAADLSGCRPTSCRVVWSEMKPEETSVDLQNITVVDQNNISMNVNRFLSLNPDETNPRDVLLFADKTMPGALRVFQDLIPATFWGGVVGINDPSLDFTQMNFADPDVAPQAWVSIMNPNICNFPAGAQGTLQNLMRGRSGMVAVDWKVLSSDEGKTITNVLPQNLPIVVDKVKVTVPGVGTSEVPVALASQLIDFENGALPFSIDLANAKVVRDWLMLDKGNKENAPNYLEAKIDFECHIDSSQILDTKMPYAFTIVTNGTVNF